MVDGAMNATVRIRQTVSWLPAAILVVLVIVPPALARQHKAPPSRHHKASQAAAANTSCDHPCEHVEDCPTVTCECADAAASGVAACDTEKTHCCVGTRTACTRFC